MNSAMVSLSVDRFIARMGWSRARILALFSIILLLIPIVVLYLDVGDGVFALLTDRDALQVFFYPLMIIYLVSIMGPLQRTRVRVAQSLRPLVQVDDDEFTDVTNRACRPHPGGELIAFAVGVAFFFGIERLYDGNPEYPFTSLYIYGAGLIMFGTISWSVYGGFMITRMTNQLLRLPIEIDIFDTEALTPIGRQSLYLSLTFVGATLLSLPFVVPAEDLSSFLSFDNILIYSLLIGLTLAVFFINMHRTHALLANAKAEELKRTDDCLARAYYRLHGLIADHQETESVSIELNALAISKREIELTRTWPYDTATLRTLFVSVITPLMIGLSRVLLPLLTN